MDLSKSVEFFSPASVSGRIHIIGCGSIGATVAENIVRLGVKNIVLYDFDTVSSHNIANQIFRAEDIGRKKTGALVEILAGINPEVKETITVIDGWDGHPLDGYVFLCVDSIELRKRIAEENATNPAIRAMFDFRTRLTDSQHYAADWANYKMVKDFLQTMSFTQEEGKAATPVSACGVELSFVPNIRSICAIGVSNFVNFIKSKTMKKMVVFDPYTLNLIAY